MPVKERPILFSGPMVKAILSGVKMQTRRPVKPQPPERWVCHELTDSGARWAYQIPSFDWHVVKCPYGIPGDRLWCRETFWRDKRDPNGIAVYAAEDSRFYKTRMGRRIQLCDDGMSNEYLRNHKWWEQRPSIFMPRWASRILLEVCSVRVERLADISEEDAIAEGVNDANPGPEPPHWRFKERWEAIYGKDAWTLNPFVWCMGFRRLEP